METRNVDVAMEQLAPVYGRSVRVGHLGKPSEFSTRVLAASFGEVVLAKGENASWSLARETKATITLVVPLDGVMHFRSGSRVHDLEGMKDIGIGRPFDTTHAATERCQGLSLAMPFDGIVERAERLTGESFGDSLISSMVARLDAAAPMGKALSRSMKAAMVEVSNLDSLGMGALAAASYEDLLLNLGVACLFPPVASSMGATPVESGPEPIRRARDFIRAHAAGPIDFSRLAADLGISMRALQENFQRYFGCSPRAYLLECRLDLARQSLMTPKVAASVTSIGFDCGFGDLSHFSARYREKFGESPSETLRAARRQLS